MPGLWRRSPGQPPQGRRRSIRGGALINLRALQSAIGDGSIGEDQIWIATQKCKRDLGNYRWEFKDVLQMLQCLQDGDYSKSEWCETSNGQIHACDVYVFPYDRECGVRNVCGLDVYLKFSITERGQLTLVLISCHGA